MAWLIRIRKALPAFHAESQYLRFTHLDVMKMVQRNQRYLVQKQRVLFHVRYHLYERRKSLASQSHNQRKLIASNQS